MGIFATLTRKQKEAIGLLSIGTFLEYFDLMLYVHMAVLLNDLFFPPTDPHTAQLLAAFAFCATFVFRPLGALVFGYLGDTIGRRATLVITTFLMAIACIIMATTPTYAQIGITAAWIITLCRVVQGLAAMGEIIGAELYLTEAIQPPTHYPAVGLIGCAADIGATTALGIAALTTAMGFSWRIAFFIGAGVALVGSAARTVLRETPTFADAKRRLQNAFEGTGQDDTKIKQKPLYKEPVRPKTSLAYFLIKCGGPVFFYLIYMHAGHVLKHTFHYTPHDVLVHNLIVGIIQLLLWSVLRTYLSAKVYPLTILKAVWAVCAASVWAWPLWLANLQTPLQLFLFQTFLVVFRTSAMPAVPIFFKHFPVFKRFTYASFLHALARTLVYPITSLGLVYLLRYFGNWGLLLLLVPFLAGFGWALFHFEKLEKATEVYPQEKTAWGLLSAQPGQAPHVTSR